MRAESVGSTLDRRPIAARKFTAVRQGAPSLGQLLEKGPVVVSFLRVHWCPYCRISADALAHIEPEVEAASGHIVVITPEVQKYTKTLKRDAQAAFPILTDLDSGYALELGLAIKIDDDKRDAMTLSGWDISHFKTATPGPCRYQRHSSWASMEL